MDTKIFIYCLVGFVIIKYWTKYNVWHLIKEQISVLDFKVVIYISIFASIIFLFRLSNHGGRKIAEKMSKRKS